MIRKHIVCIIIIIAFLANISPKLEAGGVVLITHGFMGDVDDWIVPMARALANYPFLLRTNTVCYEIFFEPLPSGGYVPRQRRIAGGDPAEVDSGTIIIKLDWSQLAGSFTSVEYRTTDVAPSVASALRSTNFIPELRGRALVEQPLHLVGHSRGGSLVCEIARILGEDGIWVDHLTTLDPHPLNNDFDDTFVTTLVDAPAVVWENTVFADNYYQVNNSLLGRDPSGQYMTGAYNRYIDDREGGYSGFLSPNHHSNVHLWYHGTIDLRTPATDSQATIREFERQNWWAPMEFRGEIAGMYYSLLGRGDRLSDRAPAGGTNRIYDGLNKFYDFGMGVRGASRIPLSRNTGIWPSLLTFNLGGEITEQGGLRLRFQEAGAGLAVKLRYQAGRSSANFSISVFLDRDLNPYNGNSLEIDSVAVPPTGALTINIGSRDLSTANAAPRVHFVGAMISDGVRSRYLYAPEILVLTPSSRAPQLAIAAMANGIVTFDVVGVAGQKLVLWEASRLNNWQPVETNTLSSSRWRVPRRIDSTPLRFYRAQLLE